MRICNSKVVGFTFGIGLAIAASTIAASAATFFDSLGGTTLNPDLSIDTTPGFHVTLPGGPGGAVFTHDAGTGNGRAGISSNFTFSGNFVLSVHIVGMFSGLSNVAEGGLGIGSGSFSDIFGYNNDGVAHVNNFLGASLTDTHIGPNEELLTITGNLAGPLVLDLFLLQEYGGTSANQLSFADLRLDADQINGLVATPLPAALPLFATGLGVMGWLARRRKRKTAAALAA